MASLYLQNLQQLEKEITSLADGLELVVKSAYISQSGSRSQNQNLRVPCELPELLVERLINSGRAAIDITSELKRTTILSKAVPQDDDQVKEVVQQLDACSTKTKEFSQTLLQESQLLLHEVEQHLQTSKLPTIGPILSPPREVQDVLDLYNLLSKASIQ